MTLKTAYITAALVTWSLVLYAIATAGFGYDVFTTPSWL
jgi:hypothetical protein